MHNTSIPKNYLTTSHKRIKAIGLIVLFPILANANSLSIGHSQLEQKINLQNSDVLLSPAGKAAFLSLDITEDLSLGVNYQTWQDDKKITNKSDVDIEMQTWGASLSYFHDNWFFSGLVLMYNFTYSIHNII